MEKDIKLGSNADLDMKLSGGVMTISMSASQEDGAVKETASVSANAGLFIDKLEALVEAKSGPGPVVVEKIVFAQIKSILLAQ